MAEHTVTLNVNNEVSTTLVKKPTITLLSGDTSEKAINTALSSIQNALNEIVRQVNEIQTGGGDDKEITLSLSDDKKTLNVNIKGTAQKAFDDEDGNNLKDTYLNENNMTLDRENQTLYMYSNKTGGN